MGVLTLRQDEVIKLIQDSLGFCKQVVTRFNKGGVSDKKYILKKLGRTMTIKDGMVEIEGNLPFIEFKKIKKLTEENKEWLELTPALQDNDKQTFGEIETVWSGRRGSNSRPFPWEGNVLPTELLPRLCRIIPP